MTVQKNTAKGPTVTTIPSPEGLGLGASPVRPFDAAAQMIADLMEQRGFRVGRGTYHHGNGDTLPTWVIDRPEDPAWLGVWQPWEIEPEMPEDGEAQTLLSLCGEAIERWNEVAWMYCDAPNVKFRNAGGQSPAS